MTTINLCPVCGDEVTLYAAVHEFHCQNCGWDEETGVPMLSEVESVPSNSDESETSL